jgi:hypothetical protein
VSFFFFLRWCNYFARLLLQNNWDQLAQLVKRNAPLIDLRRVFMLSLHVHLPHYRSITFPPWSPTSILIVVLVIARTNIPSRSISYRLGILQNCAIQLIY